jgi:sulfur carrier protein ThiS
MSTLLRVEVEYDNMTSEVNLPSGSTVEDLLKRQRMHPDSFIIVMRARPVPITRILVDGDRLKIIKVASGG